MQDHYTTEQLRDRGWTSLMIQTHLRKDDEQKSDPNGRLRKSVKLYRIERVHAAEASAARSDFEKWSEATVLAKRALQLQKNKHDNRSVPTENSPAGSQNQGSLHSHLINHLTNHCRDDKLPSYVPHSTP